MRDKSVFLPIDQFSLYKTYLFTHKHHILHLHPPISDKKRAVQRIRQTAHIYDRFNP